MKRWIALVLTTALLSALLVGCGSKQTNKDYFHDYLTVEAAVKKFSLNAERESKSSEVSFGNGVWLPASDDLYDFSQSWSAAGVKFWDFTGEVHMTADGYQYGKKTVYGDPAYGFEAKVSPRMDDFDYAKTVREISKYYGERSAKTDVIQDTPQELRCVFYPTDGGYHVSMEVNYEDGHVTYFSISMVPEDNLWEPQNAATSKARTVADYLNNNARYVGAFVALVSIDDQTDDDWQRCRNCFVGLLNNQEDEKEDEWEMAALEGLNNHPDRDALFMKADKWIYDSAMQLYNEGDFFKSAKMFMASDNYSYPDSRAMAVKCWESITVRETISGGKGHTVGLKADGTVVAVGNNDDGQCKVAGWKDIVAISAAGDGHTVGLKADGTVVAVGNNLFGQCKVSDWKDIVAISAGGSCTVGLKADGTVVAVGHNYYGECDVSGWRDIVAISAAGNGHTVGLKADGTVVAVGNNGYGQCDVSDWKDIVAISAGSWHTVGLKADGTVVAVGDNEFGQCNVSEWKDIVAISAGGSTVGLKSNGTVVCTNYLGQNVSEWKDIVAISAGFLHIIGLKADGTVVAVGNNRNGQCDVSGWKGIKIPDR